MCACSESRDRFERNVETLAIPITTDEESNGGIHDLLLDA